MFNEAVHLEMTHGRRKSQRELDSALHCGRAVARANSSPHHQNDPRPLLFCAGSFNWRTVRLNVWRAHNWWDSMFLRSRFCRNDCERSCNLYSKGTVSNKRLSDFQSADIPCMTTSSDCIVISELPAEANSWHGRRDFTQYFYNHHPIA